MNEIEIILKLRDQASRQASGIAGKLKSAFRAIPGPVKLAAVAVVAGIAAIGAAAIGMAVEFDKGMREVNTLVGGSESVLRGLKEQVLAMSSEFGVAAKEAVPALYQAISAGVPPNNAVNFLKVAATAAIGGVTTLETSVNGLTTALKAYQIPASEASHVADVFFSAVKAGKTTMKEMSESLFNVAPLAHSVGIGLEETAAAMSALTTAGTPTSVAATQVRAAIIGLIKPSKEMTALFNAAGFASGEMAIKQIGLVEAMKIVEKAAGGSASQMKALVGRVEGVQAILSLTGAQADVFNETLYDMQNRSGQAQGAFDEMNKSVSRQWFIIKNKLNVTLIRLGERVLPEISKALKWLSPLMDEFNDRALKAFDDIIAFIRNEFLPAFREWWPAIRDIMVSIVDTIKATIAIIRGDWEGAWQAFIDIIDRLSGGAVTAASNFAKGMANAIYQWTVEGLNKTIRKLNEYVETYNRTLGKVLPNISEFGEISTKALFQVSEGLTHVDAATISYRKSASDMANQVEVLSDTIEENKQATIGSIPPIVNQTAATREATAAVRDRIAATQALNKLLLQAASSAVQAAREIYAPSIARHGSKVDQARAALRAAKDEVNRLRGGGDRGAKAAAREASKAAKENLKIRLAGVARAKEIQQMHIAQAQTNMVQTISKINQSNRAARGRGEGGGIIQVIVNQNAPVTVDDFQKEVERAVVRGVDLGQFRGRLQVVTK